MDNVLLSLQRQGLVDIAGQLWSPELLMRFQIETIRVKASQSYFSVSYVRPSNSDSNILKHIKTVILHQIPRDFLRFDSRPWALGHGALLVLWPWHRCRGAAPGGDTPSPGRRLMMSRQDLYIDLYIYSLSISIVYMNDLCRWVVHNFLQSSEIRKRCDTHHSGILLNSFLNDSKPAFARTWATPQTQRGGDWKIGVAKLLALFGRFSSSGIDASTQPAFAKLPKASGETAEFLGKKLWENR